MRPTNLLSTVVCLALLIAPATAQATWYVDGQLGVDSPANGAIPTAPWRTLTYALAHMPPQPSVQVVRVQGDQTYGPGTNGETFPLLLPLWIRIEGAPGPLGQRPTLAIPAGATGFVLPAGSGALGPLLADLIVQGGATGLRCGAAATAFQRIEATNCDFNQQTFAGVHVQPAGGVEELTLRDCTVVGAASGGTSGIYYDSESAKLTLERCRFVGGAAVQLWFAPTGSGLRRLDAHECTLEQSGFVGLGDAGTWSNPAQWSFIDCRFVDGPAFIDQPISGRLSILLQRCAFVRCNPAISCAGTMYSGSTDWTIDRCAFDDCTGAVSCSSSFHGVYRFTVQDTVVRGFTTAFQLYSGGEFAVVELLLRRCRVVHGVTAIRHSGMPEAGRILVESSTIARCSGDAIDFTGFHGPSAPAYQRFELVHATIADCQRGVFMFSEAAFNTIEHVTFDGNATDVTLPATVVCSGCLTDGPPLPGVGNVANTDAGLSRPQYKLLPSSPCIDAGGAVSAVALDYEGDPRVLAGTPTGTPAADIGADEYAPYGSLRTIGFPGRTPTSLRPAIATNSTSARLGLPYDVRLTGAAPTGGLSGTGFAFLASGLRDLAEPLPFDLAAFGVPGSYLWMDPQDVGAPLPVSAAGTAATTFQLPYFPQLAGLPIVHQWLVVLPGPHGFVATDALRVTLAN